MAAVCPASTSWLRVRRGCAPLDAQALAVPSAAAPLQSPPPAAAPCQEAPSPTRPNAPCRLWPDRRGQRAGPFRDRWAQLACARLRAGLRSRPCRCPVLKPQTLLSLAQVTLAPSLIHNNLPSTTHPRRARPGHGGRRNPRVQPGERGRELQAAPPCYPTAAPAAVDLAALFSSPIDLQLNSQSPSRPTPYPPILAHNRSSTPPSCPRRPKRSRSRRRGASRAGATAPCSSACHRQGGRPRGERGGAAPHRAPRPPEVQRPRAAGAS